MIRLLTDHDIKYLKVIKAYKDKNDFYPTIREMLKLLKLNSTATIHSKYHLLVKKGYLKRSERGIYVLTNEAIEILNYIGGKR